MQKENKKDLKNEKEVKPFGFKDKFGYFLGDIGNDFVFQFASMYLMIFYTKVWGVSASLVGTLFLVSRFLDAFTDIGMGTLLDKSNPTKDGKFRPWIKRMCGPLALSSFLMYQSSLANASMGIKVAVMFATYILWGSVFYTATNISYGSMASVMTEDPTERASLSTWRGIGATVAGIFVGSITPQIIYRADAMGNQIVDPAKFTLIAGIFSVLSFIAFMSCYVLCTERVKFDKKDNSQENVSVIKNLGSLLKNKALFALILSSITILLGGFVAQSMNQYLFADYFKNINALSIVSIITIPVGFLAGAFSVKLASKFGKKEVNMVSLTFSGIIFILAYFLKIENAWVYVGLFSLTQIGMILNNMLTWANVTDVIDYSELLNGKRDDGAVYGLYSFARKIGSALSGGIGGYALALIGYNSSVANQTVEVANGIYSVATLLPGICFLATGLIFAFVYPLSKKVVEENAEKLAELRKNA